MSANFGCSTRDVWYDFSTLTLYRTLYRQRRAISCLNGSCTCSALPPITSEPLLPGTQKIENTLANFYVLESKLRHGKVSLWKFGLSNLTSITPDLHRAEKPSLLSSCAVTSNFSCPFQLPQQISQEYTVYKVYIAQFCFDSKTETDM